MKALLTAMVAVAMASLSLAEEAPAVGSSLAAAEKEGQSQAEAALSAGLSALVGEMVSNVVSLNEALASVTDTASANAAAPKVTELLGKAAPIQDRVTTLVNSNPEAFPLLLSLLEENSSRMKEVQDALNANIQRIMGDDESPLCFGSTALHTAMAEMLPKANAEEELNEEPEEEQEGIPSAESEGAELPPLPDGMLGSVMQEAIGMMGEVISVLSSIHDTASAEAAVAPLENLSRRSEELFGKVRGYAIPTTEEMEPYEEKIDACSLQLDSLLESLYEKNCYGCEALEEVISVFGL